MINKNKVLKEHIEFLQREILMKKNLNPNKIDLIDYENLIERKDILFKEYQINLYDGIYKKLIIAREYENKIVLYKSDESEHKVVEKF